VTDSSTIQDARDVLAKWREGTTPGQWQVNLIWSLGMVWDDAMLAVGTAGNPELLDAIDEGLRQYGTLPDRSVPSFIKRIAAAIVAANERMSA
jgi:hypothetical protein